MSSSTASDTLRVTFRSQKEWFDWLDDAQTSTIRNVRCMTLVISNVNSSVLSNYANKQLVDSVFEVYKREAYLLDQGLVRMTGLLQLHIFPPDSGLSKMIPPMYHSFLRSIVRRLPNLRRLDLNDNENILRHIPELESISELNLIGETPANDGHSSHTSSSRNYTNRAPEDSKTTRGTTFRRPKTMKAT